MKLNYLLSSLLMAGLLALPSMADIDDENLDADVNGPVVEFHIAKGTGNGPWNTRQTIVNVKVGQTLRIINDDDVQHRLHTFNDRPCAHQGPDSQPGEFYDCVIATTANPDIDLMYDHNFGATSRFYVKATR